MSTLIDILDGQLLDGLVFCKNAYEIFELMRAEPDGIERFQQRTSNNEKRLLDEILPICRYIQTYYRQGRYISVCWQNGSQKPDAKLSQSGELITQGYYEESAYLEVTSAMHPNEHYTWELLRASNIVYAPEGIDTQKGTPLKSEPFVFTNSEAISNFAPFIIESIRKKSENNYPQNTSLVIQCHLNNLYMPNEWKSLITEVENKVISTPFNEILLIDSLTGRASPLAICTDHTKK